MIRAVISNLQFFGFSNVDIGVTADGQTIVCYHPSVDIPYELTQVRDYQCVSGFMTQSVSSQKLLCFSISSSCSEKGFS